MRVNPSPEPGKQPPTGFNDAKLTPAFFLQPGDRIQSLHARRSGAVVKVYADGSACVCWDDGEPQEAGLGHERMPGELLVKVAAAAIDSDAHDINGGATSSARRKLYMRERMKVLLRYADGSELDCLEDMLEKLVGDITCSRYVPGLVAADYELTRKHWIKGGAQ